MGLILTDAHIEDDKLIVTRNEDVEDVLKENHFLRDEAVSKFGHAAWRLAGRLPLVIAEQWAKECGSGVGTREFAAYCKRKLMDGDNAAFLIKGY